MNLCNSAFFDVLPPIFSNLMFYEQHALARTGKLLYNKYCEYKKKLLQYEFKSYSEYQSINILILIFSDGTIKHIVGHDWTFYSGFVIELSKRFPDAWFTSLKSLDCHKSHKTFDNKPIIGFIDIIITVVNIQFNLCVTLPFSIEAFHDNCFRSKNAIDLDKYNAIKFIDCPTVDCFVPLFTGKHKYYDSYSELQKIHFDHSKSVNYCSSEQCISEIVSLYNLFQMHGEETFKSLLKKWIFDGESTSDESDGAFDDGIHCDDDYLFIEEQ